RFSTDFDVIDRALSHSFSTITWNGTICLGTVLFVSLTFPVYLLVLLPLAFTCYVFQRYYRKSSLELRRLESLLNSPFYVHFAESLSGVTTIRATNTVEAFCDKALRLADHSRRAPNISAYLERWFAVRLDLAAGILSFVT